MYFTIMSADVADVLQTTSVPPEVVVLEARSLEMVQDHSKGVVDTAVARSVTGGPWTSAYLARLDTLDLSHLVSKTVCGELLCVGDGVAVKCSVIICAP